MDNRFINPYDVSDPPRNQRPQRQQQAMQQAAIPMGMEEALYLQRQNQLQRDLQIRQLLLQEQLERQSRQNSLFGVASSLQQQQEQQRLYELQQYAQAGRAQTMANLREEQQMLLNQQRQEQILLNQQQEEQMLLKQQEHLRRYQLQQQQQQHHNLQMGVASAAMGNELGGNEGLRGADNYGGATLRTPASAASRKRSAASHPSDHDFDIQSFKAQIHRNDPISRDEFSKREFQSRAHDRLIHDDGAHLEELLQRKPSAKRHKTFHQQASNDDYALLSSITEAADRDAVEALLQGPTRAKASPSPVEVIQTLGTVENLLEAAADEEKNDEAATIMTGLKKVDWPDSEEEEEESAIEDRNAITIELPNFKSTLPTLQEEPVFEEKKPVSSTPAKGTKDKTQEDEAKENGDAHPSGPPSEVKTTPKGKDMPPIEYPYPVDTWWPSITTIRRERRLHGDKSDEEFFAEPALANEDTPFRADLPTIQSRFAKDVEPGVLEKLPHCRIHRQRMRSQKGKSAPDHAFCWQVTESYCNDVMVCCSICSSWRHASCGGHYKSFSVRDCILSNTPFVPICDQCHEEQKILQMFPKGKARLERQRTEQLRRALETSAVIRQASFAKHSGTYKWPLGSVSATHIGGHTRSVNSRHDKADKHWSEMSQKLGRGFGFRPKERSKMRTRELERLLVSIEDAEAYTDRHNMMQFLQDDSRKERPAGFSKPRRNLFDPEDDEYGDHDGVSPHADQMGVSVHIGRKAGPQAPHIGTGPIDKSKCIRKGCEKKPRFDSMFCSDACGIVALESDLLRAFLCAEDIHPSLLRTS